MKSYYYKWSYDEVKTEVKTQKKNNKVFEYIELISIFYTQFTEN